MLLDEIADRIALAQFGVVGTTIFKGEMPTSPINCTVVYEMPGKKSQHTLDLNLTHEYPEIHIVTRHTTAVAARARCEAIMHLLSRVKNEYLGDTFYLSIHPLSTPTLLQPDENKNHMCLLRMEAFKTISDVPLYTF